MSFCENRRLAGSRIRILIADDHDVVRAGMRALLEAESDFEVCGEARDGREALKEACRLAPDVVILDFSMPGMNGLEVTRRIRALSGELASVPIIGVSGHTALSDERAARAAGMDAFLAKPVSPGALTEAIAKATQPRSR